MYTTKRKSNNTCINKYYKLNKYIKPIENVMIKKQME